MQGSGNQSRPKRRCLLVISSRGMHFPHPVEDVSGDHFVTYQVKFQGIYNVGEPSGKSAVVGAYIDMQKNKSIRRKFRQDTPTYELQMSVKQLRLNPVLSNQEDPLIIPLKKISYCTQQNPYTNYIFFIITERSDWTERMHESDMVTTYRCLVLKHKKQSIAKDIVFTFAECMQLISERGRRSEVSVDGDGSNQKVVLHQLQSENEVLRSRLEDVSFLLPKSALANYLQSHQITKITDIGASTVRGSVGHTLKDNDKSMSLPQRRLVNPPQEASNESSVNWSPLQSSTDASIGNSSANNVLQEFDPLFQ